MDASNEAGTWKILFTLEMDLEQGRWRLGAFMCFLWPAAYAQRDGQKIHEATLVMLEAAGADVDAAGLPNMKAISEFLSYTQMRSMFDNKATWPLMLEVPQQITREQMEVIVDSSDRETLNRWRKECAIPKKQPVTARRKSK